jgi:CheY-like chemotaxis protein
MHIVVASSSVHRQTLYREAIEGLGHRVSAANGGVECVEQLRDDSTSLLVLEAPLLWGGSDGVLDIIQNDLKGRLPVILVAVGSGSIDLFQLSRFRVDDFLFRVPGASELERSISTLASKADNRKRPDRANKHFGETRTKPSLPRESAPGALSSDPQTAWRNAESAPGERRTG